MGLDGVELVMDLEEEFGIRISDEEASRTITMADVFLLICRLRGVGPAVVSSEDLSAFAAVFRETGLRDALSDHERLDDVVPVHRRHELWQRLEEARRPGLPPLRSPLGLGGGVAWATVGAVLGTLGGAVGAAFGAIAGTVLAVIVSRKLRATRPRFPRGLRTVADLNAWWRPLSSSADVWLKLVEITANQVGVAKEDIRPESRLVADLQLG